MSKLLEEIKDYSDDWLEELKPNGFTQEYIDIRCRRCINHSILNFKNKDWNICNDNWSKLNGDGVGEHIIYGETVDLCIECEGFKKL
jgi:hypothetical protein